jgi:hypothetical protein
MSNTIDQIQECTKTIVNIKDEARRQINATGEHLVNLIKKYLSDIGIKHGIEVKPIRINSLRDYYKNDERLTFTDIEPCEDSPKFVFFTHKKDGTVSRRETKINFSSLKPPYLTKVP